MHRKDSMFTRGFNYIATQRVYSCQQGGAEYYRLSIYIGKLSARSKQDELITKEMIKLKRL